MKLLREWRRILLAARTRVITSYVVLVLFSTVVSLLAIRQILITHLEENIENALVQEVEEFRRLMKGRRLKTGQPFGENVALIFDVFLARNVPNDDEFLITILDGKVYKFSHTAIPASLHPTNSELIKVWAKLTQPKRGETITPDGTILYLAEPVRIRGKTRGVFVVARIPASEYGEVNYAVAIVAVVEGIMAIIALSSSIAWLASGKIITRLRLLSETARSISQSDLTQRIPVQGSDEITELTITFNEMLERLQAAFSSQRDFMNDASHELRTPIAIIRCSLEQLRTEFPEQPEMLALVFDELERMSRLVDELLVLAKAEHPNFLNLEIVEISSLTEELYVKASTLADRNWCLETKGSGRIIADRQRLTQAVMNLVQNAIYHTTECNQITLGSILIHDQFRLWVRDTGEGIAPAQQQKIFQRFVRGDTHRRSDGAGLGLAIVKAIAEAHGGWVELISQPGNESTFTIVIPV
ncbi:sensor histidine kinase [Mastigocladopsis repens]|uniref:sensor histidine kinase n=1 Tax=Mastigocladopsis repens TaxID=221287 RepID=UPI000370840E|nr:ATP-binding protein [Mastigocladopsis repens]